MPNVVCSIVTIPDTNIKVLSISPVPTSFDPIQKAGAIIRGMDSIAPKAVR